MKAYSSQYLIERQWGCQGLSLELRSAAMGLASFLFAFLLTSVLGEPSEGSNGFRDTHAELSDSVDVLLDEFLRSSQLENHLRMELAALKIAQKLFDARLKEKSKTSSKLVEQIRLKLSGEIPQEHLMILVAALESSGGLLIDETPGSQIFPALGAGVAVALLTRPIEKYAIRKVLRRSKREAPLPGKRTCCYRVLRALKWTGGRVLVGSGYAPFLYFGYFNDFEPYNASKDDVSGLIEHLKLRAAQQQN